MPSRIIRESCRSSPTLAKLSHGAERMFWRLITVADDYGQFEANPTVMRAECFKAMLNSVTEDQIKDWLRELVKAGLVNTYRVNGKPFGSFKTWFKHQRKRTSQPKYPPPPLARTGGNSPQVALDRRSRARASEGMGYRAEGIGDGESPPTAAATQHVSVNGNPESGECQPIPEEAKAKIAELKAMLAEKRTLDFGKGPRP